MVPASVPARTSLSDGNMIRKPFLLELLLVSVLSQQWKANKECIMKCIPLMGKSTSEHVSWLL